MIRISTSSAAWQYSVFDHVVNGLSFFGLAMPVFWFGLMLQLLFAVQLGWLPSADIGSGGVDYLHHIILPAVMLAVGTVAGWRWCTRTTFGLPGPRGCASRWSSCAMRSETR